MPEFVSRLLRDRSENIFVQFFRYAIVGGIASLVDVSVFYLITNVIGKDHIFANTLSFVMGLLVNYFMSRSWVFNKKENNFIRDFTMFAIVGLLGLLLSNFILYVLINRGLINRILGFLNEEMKKLISKLIAVFIVLFWNFIGRKIVVADIGIRSQVKP